eukprot:TRINITY_DN5558_c0_g1_i1.p1 TRINITY_DN5558_c0_g1~~TRINITY_DN5558_c0_g1_i1.p1  ORF type:complete len:177 (-),score=41.51 TRINITY_DN5558_c0_g1_i1:13-543(-)
MPSLQPHLEGGFVHTPIVAAFGLLAGAAAGYWFPAATGAWRSYWARAYAPRITLAIVLGALGTLFGFNEDFSILYSACLGYMCGLACGCAVTTLRDDVRSMPDGEELTMRQFAVLWLPALLGGVVGGMYNELMHGAPFFIATLKIVMSIAACTTATFALLFLVQLLDARHENRLKL